MVQYSYSNNTVHMARAQLGKNILQHPAQSFKSYVLTTSINY